ncbi:MAG TPA: type 4a pilus biogenesis protein PilO [Tepidisphaeraceae bacterium]|jgi:Tfp pilus assembly protein PilO|nr:type 4a pilus biogenesis protein PilO [Tepidisphaeraceae bacterium]
MKQMVSLQNQIRWCARAQLTLGGILLLVVVAFYVFGYRPITTQQKKLDSQIQTMQHELSDNLTRSQILPQVAVDVKNLRLKLDGAKKLPKDVDVAGFITDLTSISQSTQLRKPDYKPQAPKRGEMFSLYPIDLRLQGSFANVFQFIRETESLPRLSRVRSIHIQSDSKTSGEVIVNLSMDLYFSPDL